MDVYTQKHLFHHVTSDLLGISNRNTEG